MRDWTYGAEHELADWPLATELPPGYGRDKKDITVVNSNGVANDPTGRYYGHGGEINTPPTATIEGQVDCLREIKRLLPMATVNYRSNLHIHIRVPGLRDDLAALRQVQRYVHEHLPRLLEVVEPLPRPTLADRVAAPLEARYSDEEWLEGALRRWRRRRVSHQTLLTPKRLARQLDAPDVGSFFEWEVPHSRSGRPLWHCQPRLAVNVRQLLETDTVEFRHFPGTLDEDEFHNCVEWCARFMEAALGNRDPQALLSWARDMVFPDWEPYYHWMEVRYRATVHDGTIDKTQIVENIRAIEEGRFND